MISDRKDHGGGSSSSGGGMVDEPARLVWGDISNPHMLTTALPFRVTLTAVRRRDEEPLPDYCGQLTISALTVKVCLSEGFEGRRLGLWYVPIAHIAMRTPCS